MCDDGNADDADGCLNCLLPKSCAEILTLAPASPSGPYHIDPKGSGAPWPVTCDMDKDGGGWTGFSVQDTCNGHLDSAVVALKKAESEGIDRECRPFSFYPNGGNTPIPGTSPFPPASAPSSSADTRSRVSATSNSNTHKSYGRRPPNGRTDPSHSATPATPARSPMGRRRRA
ncbi:MAG: hypothetical protein IPK80_01870 [Nannocystis sp.]|nr:hypothetical protein [Nannocystis sp.]